MKISLVIRHENETGEKPASTLCTSLFKYISLHNCARTAGSPRVLKEIRARDETFISHCATSINLWILSHSRLQKSPSSKFKGATYLVYVCSVCAVSREIARARKRDILTIPKDGLFQQRCTLEIPIIELFRRDFCPPPPRAKVEYITRQKLLDELAGTLSSLRALFAHG